MSQQHVSFVLLAEFDIDQGALLSRQFPTPLGTDEQLLAGLMLPDGAEKQSEDWTIFFLNQTPMNMVAPLFTEPSEKEESEGKDGQELLYVLSLVRTKRDQTARRGGIVKAMAICTHHPFIHVFKPVLLIALDDYFVDPTMECLERLYDSINAMDLTLMPQLSRSEKILLRCSDRKDVFLEKFSAIINNNNKISATRNKTRSDKSTTESVSEDAFAGRRRTLSTTSTASSTSSTSNAIWVNGKRPERDPRSSAASPEKPRRVRSRIDDSLRSTTDPTSSEESHTKSVPAIKDTHYFETSISYKGIPLPIRIPLYSFPEEIGEYSMVQLIQTFSAPGAAIQGPLHPHLHTNGALTHPIILLFNAIVTGKRVLFLGYGKPAGLVSNFVLAACALGSGCGSVLRGLTERAFPYANLTSKEVVESVPGFIAGVTNPIFESARCWDILCNIDSAKITVNKDIQWPHAPVTFPSPPNVTPRAGVIKADVSIAFDEESGRTSSQANYVNGQKSNEFTAKTDNADNMFMDEILSLIQQHYGENVVRARFSDYTGRFVRMASRFEEESTGTTTIGFPSRLYADGSHGEFGQLGSGLNFWDEAGGLRELQLNANRLDGWRKTKSYHYFREDFKELREKSSMQGFDLVHQVWRLKHCKSISDREAELIMRTLAEHVQTYEQVVELLALLPPHNTGILPLAHGLFHQQEPIRDIVVEILDVLRAYPVGYQLLQSLNPFHRFAYVRLAQAREERMARDPNRLLSTPWTSRTPSNRSESSLAGG